MRISPTKFPQTSVLASKEAKLNFRECYALHLNKNLQQITVQDIGMAFVGSMPGWVDKLNMLRNKVVGWFGLKYHAHLGALKENLDLLELKPGTAMGRFEIAYLTPNELVLGRWDKHYSIWLSFLISSRSDNKKELICTVAHKHNNWFGKLYLQFTINMHLRICKMLMKSLVHALKHRVNTLPIFTS